MAQTLEAIRGGGGSVKVGTTGTISALISRELESIKSNPSSSCSSISVPKPATSADEESSSSCKNLKVPENTRKTKNHTGSTHQIPMLTPDNISTDGTPIRQKKPGKKGVEIVDIKCRNSNIAHRLKKLGFSKTTDI